jgi:hypothetical protein
MNVHQGSNLNDGLRVREQDEKNEEKKKKKKKKGRYMVNREWSSLQGLVLCGGFEAR